MNLTNFKPNNLGENTTSQKSFLKTNLLFILAKKEFRLLYKSPVLYAVIIFFILSAALLFIGGDAWFNAGLSDFRSFFLPMPFLFCVIIPMLTMNLWAEEKKHFTDKLLFSFPVSFRQIVFAKYLNLIFVWFLILCLSLLIPFSVFSLGYFSLGAFFISYLAMFFFGAGLISISSAVSLISKHSPINFLFSFLIILFFILFTNFFKFSAGNNFLRPVLEYFSFASHFETSARGIFDSRDFIFYFILIALGLELSVLILNLQKHSR